MTNPIYVALASWRRAATLHSAMTQLSVTRRIVQPERPDPSPFIAQIDSRLKDDNISALFAEVTVRKQDDGWVIEVTYDVSNRSLDDFAAIADDLGGEE